MTSTIRETWNEIEHCVGNGNKKIKRETEKDPMEVGKINATSLNFNCKTHTMAHRLRLTNCKQIGVFCKEISTSFSKALKYFK
jgi:hypothetical protein